METPGNSIPELADDYREAQAKVDRDRAEILSALLGQTIARDGQFVAFASRMGRTADTNGSLGVPVPSFTVLHSLEWISHHIRLGSEMPFMQDKIDHETGRLIVDSSNADEIKQRAPDWTRQAALAAYLAQPQRKFGPIMAVISPNWVEHSSHGNWNKDGRALTTSAEFTPIEPSGRVGLLKLDGVRLYALDGQHRVLGMRGLRELQERGTLQLRSHDGTPRGGTMSRSEFCETFRVRIEDLQFIFEDTLPVEYTPAVVIGETHAEATRRIRRTFIAINSYAKKTDKGENILLDETDGFAVVARRLGVTHPLFKADDGEEPRVNWKGASITAGSSHLTTLSTLKEVAAAYLPMLKPEIFEHWRAPIRGMMPIRPPDAEIELGSDLILKLFDRIVRLPVFQILQRASSHEYASVLNRWREFPEFDVFASRTCQDRELGSNRGHLLLRPLGQLILVKAVAELVASEANGGHGLGLDFVFRALEHIASNRGFEMPRPQTVWYGVTYGSVRGRIVTRNKSWAHRLVVQQVHGLRNESETMSLWRNWVTCRIVDPRRQTWKNLDGEVVHFEWDYPELPEPVDA